MAMAGVVDSIRWHKSRLAAMSGPELGHRVAEQFARLAGRRFSKGWDEIAANGNIAALPNVRRAWNEVPEKLKLRVDEQARRTMAGQFELLGASWAHTSEMPPEPAFWHLDEQGVPWSRSDEYCFDVSYRTRAGRDVKPVWEINRLQFLVPLAVHARLTGDPRISKVILGIIFSWMQGNPPYCGVNWISGVELALRAISVALALSIVGLDKIGHADLIKIERFFAAHLFWLRRFPSLHSSENNHRIAELAGSLICTAVAPEIEPEKDSRAELDQLLVQLESQILEDGVGAEQSTTYAAFSIELALVAFLSLSVAPEQLPASVRERLSAWVDYVHWISSPAGDVPMIGDCDDGKVVGIEDSAGALYVASIAEWVEDYLNHPSVSSSRRHVDLRDALFLRPKATATPLPKAPPIGMKTWKMGGYSVWRERPPRPVVLVFDHGPLGYLSIAAHGHADTLSVWLSVDNTPVVVDAGTYVYNSSPLWRERFRSSMIHNTLSVSGVSSSSTSGPFNWAAKADVRLVSDSVSKPGEVVAEHDGYLRQFGVRHRRSAFMTSEGKVTISDELIGRAAPLPVQISFLINPRLSVRRHESRRNSILVEGAGRPIAEFRFDGPLDPHIAFGNGDTGEGWVSPSFGRINAAYQILIKGLLSKRSIVEITPLD
jgi:Heparinase II/III-like protein/Heparinase II/III N-terminus